MMDSIKQVLEECLADWQNIEEDDGLYSEHTLVSYVIRTVYEQCGYQMSVQEARRELDLLNAFPEPLGV